MKRRSNTPEYWMSLVEQHFKLGNQFALIPVDSLPHETAIALAERLGVVLEKWDIDYVFHQKMQMELKDSKHQVLH